MLIVPVLSILSVNFAVMGLFASFATGNVWFAVAGFILGFGVWVAYTVAVRLEVWNERREDRTPVTLRGDVIDARWRTLFGREVDVVIDLEHVACVQVSRGSGVYSLHFWKESFRAGSRNGFLGRISADRIKRSTPDVIERILSISADDRAAVTAALEATDEHKLYALR